MNAKEYLARLEQLLSDLSPDERRAALEYYTEYLQDACPEADADVTALLGSPEAAAAELRMNRTADAGWSAGYRRNDGSASFGECIEDAPPAAPLPPPQPAYKQPEPQPVCEEAAPQPQQSDGQKQGGSAWLPWLLVALLTSPLWIGLAGGVLGLAGGILAAVLAAVVVAAALVLVGFVMLIAAAPLLATAFGSGLVLMGAALLVAAAGLVVLGLFVWGAGALLPLLAAGTTALVRWVKGWVKKL